MKTFALAALALGLACLAPVGASAEGYGSAYGGQGYHADSYSGQKSYGGYQSGYQDYSQRRVYVAPSYGYDNSYSSPSYSRQKSYDSYKPSGTYYGGY